MVFKAEGRRYGILGFGIAFKSEALHIGTLRAMEQPTEWRIPKGAARFAVSGLGFRVCGCSPGIYV